MAHTMFMLRHVDRLYQLTFDGTISINLNIPQDGTRNVYVAACCQIAPIKDKAVWEPSGDLN